MPPNEHLTGFRKKVRGTRRLLARQVSFHSRAELPKTELESIYELAFLNVFIAFENELTELLMTNMLMATGSDGRKRSKYIPSNRVDAQRLLLGTQRYFQLLPVEQMEKIAQVYLKEGKPFTSLSSSQKGEIAKSQAIRNHIAHNSADSKKTYIKRVRSHVTLANPRSAPGYYLRSSMTRSLTYFDHHVAEMGGIMNHLCSGS